MKGHVLFVISLCACTPAFSIGCASSCERICYSECVDTCVQEKCIEGYAYPHSRVPCQLSWGGYFSWVHCSLFEEPFSIASRYVEVSYTIAPESLKSVALLRETQETFLPTPTWEGSPRIGVTVDNGHGVSFEGSWWTLKQEGSFTKEGSFLSKTKQQLPPMEISRLVLQEPTRVPTNIKVNAAWDISMLMGVLGQSIWLSPHLSCTFTTAVEGIDSETVLELKEVYERSSPPGEEWNWSGLKKSAIETKSQLVGPGVGFSPSFYVAEGCSLYSGLQTFLLYGLFEEVQTITNSVTAVGATPLNTLNKFEDRHWDCAPAIQWRCGVHIEIPVNRVFRYTSVDVGWEGCILYKHVGRSYLQYMASEPNLNELDKTSKRARTSSIKQRSALYMEGVQVRCEVGF